MNYYQHHLGDYMRDTAHLSMLEDCAYRRLLDAYYAREKPLPTDVRECCKLARAVSKAERDAVAYVLREFFELRDDGYHQRRADDEIASYQDKQAKAAASARAGWSRRRAASEGNADAMRTHSDGSANADADAMRTHSDGNANGMPRARVPITNNQKPVLHPEDADSGAAQSAPPPTPPPAFDGRNAEVLNGKAVVPIAAGFDLPTEWGMSAEALGFRPDEVLREAEKFRQYWTEGRGKGTRRSVRGWRQTWSTWLDKAAKDHR